MTTPALSKSLFKLGLGCPLRIKHSITKPSLPRRSGGDEYMRMLAEGGYMFEKLVRTYHPGDDMYVPKDTHKAAFARTLKRITNGDCMLHEATFAFNGLMARSDMVRVRGSIVDVIEIKSASVEADPEGNTDNSCLKKAEWEPYVVDLAYQVHVASQALKAAGVKKTIRAWFYVPNKAGVANSEELRGLFSITQPEKGKRPDVTYKGKAKAGDMTSLIAILDASEAVASAHPEEKSVEEAAESLSLDIANDAWPKAELSLKCKDCDFNAPGQTSGYDQCWGSQARAEHHLFTLGQLGHLEKANPGLVQRIIGAAAPRAPLVTDLQDSDIVSQGSRAVAWNRQILAVRTGKPYVSKDLAQNTEALLRCQAQHYPLFFLDYEGTRCALPSAPGCRPYGQVAFQWSCHIIDKPGDPIRHAEWLDTDSEDPTTGFLQSLKELLVDAGTIYHWGNYEVAVTQELVNEIRADRSKATLVAWADRTWGYGKGKDAVRSQRTLDLCNISREHFYDPAMKGSHSIKVVLPVAWKQKEIQKLFPEYAKDRNGNPAINPYDALPALTFLDREPSGLSQLGDLEELDIVKDGTGAMRAYEHVRYGAAASLPAVREDVRRQLLRYCQLDTAAMVMVWRYWLGN